jgi:bifunctional non-homologous end joining protein LigD
VDGVVAPLSPNGGALGYFVFDMPYFDGQDLRGAPLSKRKQLLENLVGRVAAGTPVRYLEHIEGDGAAFQAEAARLGIPAMQSRRMDSKYNARAGWLWTPLTSTRARA